MGKPLLSKATPFSDVERDRQTDRRRERGRERCRGDKKRAKQVTNLWLFPLPLVAGEEKSVDDGRPSFSLSSYLHMEGTQSGGHRTTIRTLDREWPEAEVRKRERPKAATEVRQNRSRDERIARGEVRTGERSRSCKGRTAGKDKWRRRKR
ncbi:hypothetical protein ACLOJK_029101 [Asimina triloba]